MSIPRPWACYGPHWLCRRYVAAGLSEAAAARARVKPSTAEAPLYPLLVRCLTHQLLGPYLPFPCPCPDSWPVNFLGREGVLLPSAPVSASLSHSHSRAADNQGCWGGGAGRVGMPGRALRLVRLLRKRLTCGTMPTLHQTVITCLFYPKSLKIETPGSSPLN